MPPETDGQRGRRLRVLCLLSSLIAGGAERQMLLLLRHIDRARFEPALGVLSGEGQLASEVPDDVPVISLGKTSRWDAPRLVIRLARLLRSSRPDVVLSKLDYTNCIAAAADAVARTRVPLVLGEETVQSDALEEMSHPAVRRWLLRRAYGRAAHVTAPSAGVVDELRSTFGIRGPHFAVIPNMVDLEAIARAAREPVSYPFEGSPLPLVVAVGRLAPGKGLADLLQARALSRDGVQWNLLVVGEGGDEDRLRRLAADLSVADHVAFTGFAANPFALIAQADVFVSPSHSESFGNVIIEAMAVGTPVVSTRLPHGPVTIVEDGRTGLFCNPRDPEDLAAKVRILLRDPDYARELARHARVDVARFDVSTVVPQYEELVYRAVGATR